MATLTAPEIAIIRALSGDDCTPPEVSNETMQYLHDHFASTEPKCIETLPLGGTIVWVIRSRLAKAAKLFDETGEGNAGSVSQKFDHLQALLTEWESRCGMAGGAVTISTFDMGLDSECDSEYGAYLARYHGWTWWGVFA